MRNRLLLVLLSALIIPPGEAPADQTALGLAIEERAEVIEVIDGDTVVLSNGREVRLVGIQAPKLPLGRPNFAIWPLADEAKSALSDLTLGQTVDLAFGGRRIDRHGRLLAHLFDEDGRWIQGQMLERGLARVYTFADNRALAGEMLSLERSARSTGRGIWGDPFYAVRTAEQVREDIGTFQVIEGRIADVAEVRNTTFMNFGHDWRSDFTITLDSEARRLFESEGIEPGHFEDEMVRVRGWVESWNGPMVEVSHPEQIEVFDE